MNEIGKVDYFVAAASTGGTISGTGRFLKEKLDTKVVLVDPIGSVYANYFATGELGKSHSFLVEGIGKNMLVDALDFSIIDTYLKSSD